MYVVTFAAVVKMFINFFHLLCVYSVQKSLEFLYDLCISIWYSSIECCEGRL